MSVPAGNRPDDNKAADVERLLNVARGRWRPLVIYLMSVNCPYLFRESVLLSSCVPLSRPILTLFPPSPAPPPPSCFPSLPLTLALLPPSPSPSLHPALALLPPSQSLLLPSISSSLLPSSAWYIVYVQYVWYICPHSYSCSIFWLLIHMCEMYDINAF